MKIEDLNKPDETVTEFLNECFPLINELDNPEIRDLARKNSVLAQYATMARDEGVIKLVEQTTCKAEVKAILTAALLKNILVHQSPVRSELKQSLRNQRKLFKDDYFQKKKSRRIELGYEMVKTGRSASKDAYYAILVLFEEYYAEVNPNMSQRELYALIYDKLSLLKPDPEQHFFTPQEVERLLNKDSKASEADIVTFKYDQIKRDIWKTHKS